MSLPVCQTLAFDKFIAGRPKPVNEETILRGFQRQDQRSISAATERASMKRSFPKF